MNALYRIASLAAVLLLWQGASYLVGSDVVPTPWQTAVAAKALIESGELQQALLESVSVYIAGFALAAVIGVAVGVLMGGVPFIGYILDPYAHALAATPRVAFVPLIIVLLGLGFDAKMTIVFLGAAMPILINTYVGIASGDAELVEMARSVGAGRLQIFARVLMPAAVPFIVAGLRLGAMIGLINTVVAELYTAVQGLGGLLAVYGNTFRMAQYFVVVLVLAAIGIVVAQLLRAAERRVARWRYIDS